MNSVAAHGMTTGQPLELTRQWRRLVLPERLACTDQARRNGTHGRISRMLGRVLDWTVPEVVKDLLALRQHRDLCRVGGRVE